MDSQSEFSVFPDLNESDMSLFELNNLILCVSLCVCVCVHERVKATTGCLAGNEHVLS